jgi:hypothetical protein
MLALDVLLKYVYGDCAPWEARFHFHNLLASNLVLPSRTQILLAGDLSGRIVGENLGCGIRKSSNLGTSYIGDHRPN